MAKKVVYQITRYKIETIEVETVEQEQTVQMLNRDFERADKADKTYRARCSSLETLRETEGFEVVDETGSVEETLIEEEEKSEVKAQIHKAIKKLTFRQQEMIKMIFFEDKSQDEVAKLYGITKSAVSHAMERVYATMRKFLEKNKKS